MDAPAPSEPEPTTNVATSTAGAVDQRPDDVKRAAARFAADPPPPQIHSTVVRDTFKDRAGATHVHLDALRNGEVVHGAGMIRHVRPDGHESRQDGIDSSMLVFDDTPAVLDKVAADKAARAAMAPLGHVAATKTSLGYERDGAVYRLLYRSLVAVGAPRRSEWRLWIDPSDGRVVRKLDVTQTQQTQGTGQSLYYGTLPLQTYFYPAQGANPNGFTLQDWQRPNQGTYIQTLSALDANDVAVIFPWAQFWSSNDAFGNGIDAPADWTGTTAANGPLSPRGQTAAVDVHWGAEMSWDFFVNELGRYGPYGDGKPFTNVVNSRQPDQSQYDAASGTVFIEQASMKCRTQSTIDIVGHEVSHAFFDGSFVYAKFSGEPGGLDEANSDILGTLIKAYALIRLGKAPPGTVLALGATLPTSWPDWNAYECDVPVRSLSTPSSIPGGGYDFDSAAIDADTDPHVASGPINRMFYFLAQGVAPGAGATVASPTYLPQGLAGVGIPKALDTYYRALTGYLPHEEPMFADLRNAMVSSATDAADTTMIKAVEDAFAAVNIGPPADRSGPTLSAVTPLSSPGRDVTVTVVDPSGVQNVIIGTWGDAIASSDPSIYYVTVPAGVTTGFYNVPICATDTLDNQTCASFVVQIDATPPVISTFTINNPYVAAAKTVTLAGSDNLYVNHASIGFQGFVSWSERFAPIGTQPPGVRSFTVSPTLLRAAGLADGSYELTASVSDNEANTTTKTASFLWDTMPPAPCQLYNVPSSMLEGDIFNGEVGDATSGLASVVFAVDGSTAQTYAPNSVGGQTLYVGAHIGSNASIGPHTVSVTCTDRFGLTSTASQVVTVRRPPYVAIAGHGESLDPTHAATYYVFASSPGGVKTVSSWVTCSQSGDHWTSTPVTGMPPTYQVELTVDNLVLGETCTDYANVLDGYRLTGFAITVTFTVQNPVPPTLPCTGTTTLETLDQTLSDTQYVDVGKTSGTFDWSRYIYWGTYAQFSASCAYGGTVQGVSTYSPGCQLSPNLQGVFYWAPLSFDCIAGRIRFDMNTNCNPNYSPQIDKWELEVTCAQ